MYSRKALPALAACHHLQSAVGVQMAASSSSVRCTVDADGTVHGNPGRKWWCVFDWQPALPPRKDAEKAKARAVRNTPTYVCRPGYLWPQMNAPGVHNVAWDKAFGSDTDVKTDEVTGKSVFCRKKATEKTT